MAKTKPAITSVLMAPSEIQFLVLASNNVPLIMQPTLLLSRGQQLMGISPLEIIATSPAPQVGLILLKGPA